MVSVNKSALTIYLKPNYQRIPYVHAKTTVMVHYSHNTYQRNFFGARQ